MEECCRQCSYSCAIKKNKKLNSFIDLDVQSQHMDFTCSGPLIFKYDSSHFSTLKFRNRNFLLQLEMSIEQLSENFMAYVEAMNIMRPKNAVGKYSFISFVIIGTGHQTYVAGHHKSVLNWT